MHLSGTLQTAIDRSELGRLPNAQAMYYAAEISLALMHLHSLGKQTGKHLDALHV